MLDLHTGAVFTCYTTLRLLNPAEQTVPTELNHNPHDLSVFWSDSSVCTSGAVDAFLAAGVPANKLMLGLANYGRTFLLTGEGDAPGIVAAQGEPLPRPEKSRRSTTLCDGSCCLPDLCV